MFCGGKLREIATDFRIQGVHSDGAQAGQRREVDAEDAVQMGW
jgi:hypothetical protein